MVNIIHSQLLCVKFGCIFLSMLDFILTDSSAIYRSIFTGLVFNLFIHFSWDMPVLPLRLSCDPSFVFTLCLRYSADCHRSGCSDLCKFLENLLGLTEFNPEYVKTGIQTQRSGIWVQFFSVDFLLLRYSDPQILVALTLLNTNFSFLHSGKLLNAGCLLPTVQSTSSPKAEIKALCRVQSSASFFSGISILHCLWYDD